MMNGLVAAVGAAVLLAACSVVGPDSDKPEEVAGRIMPDDDLISQPLRVPDLTELKETAERKLDANMVPVTYQALPGWAHDDLDQVWQAFIHNCKGLMRPISGNLVLPARAAPRAWQPVCRAAKQADINEQDTVAIRSFIESHLQPWRLLDTAGKPASNTVTGYYEPQVQ